MKQMPPPAQKRTNQKLRGFTLVEVLVVILIIVILIGIGLAIGAQVQANAQTSVLKEELNNLQAALAWYQQNSGGQTPFQNSTSGTPTYGIPAMLVFLENYQRMNAYQDTTGAWHEKTDILSLLPANLVVSGQFPAPSGGTYMTGVIEVLDPWGNPIQFMPSSGTANFFPLSATTSGFTTGTGNFGIEQTTSPPSFPSYVTYSSVTNTPQPPPTSSGSSAGTFPYPIGGVNPVPPHAPYFYSFGSKGPLATNIAYGNYVYSYGP
jgi:prepilin-type N-terminal cleavage/methylation domain-containing protein